MQFTSDKALLAGALKRVLPACPANSALPILGHVLLEVGGGMLSLTTTDLELRMSYGISIDAGADGAITVPGRLLQALIAKMPDEHPVKITPGSTETHLVITAGEAEYTLYGLPAEEFPVTPLPDDMRRLLLPGPQWVEMIRRTLYAISTDESRPTLCGALFQWGPENQTAAEGGKTGLATLAATDTHRLAVDRQPVTGDGEAIEALIPRRALAEMQRAIGKADDEVVLMFSEKLVALQIGGLVLCSRLIEGAFPSYERTLRLESPSTISLHPSVLLGAIDRAGLVARAESNKLILGMGAEDSRLTLDARTDVGRAHELLAASLTGDAVEIGFNAEYLHDVLSAMETTEIRMDFAGPQTSAIITGEGLDGYTCLVMPMQVV